MLHKLEVTWVLYPWQVSIISTQPKVPWIHLCGSCPPPLLSHLYSPVYMASFNYLNTITTHWSALNSRFLLTSIIHCWVIWIQMEETKVLRGIFEVYWSGQASQSWCFKSTIIRKSWNCWNRNWREILWCGREVVFVHVYLSTLKGLWPYISDSSPTSGAWFFPCNCDNTE